MNENEAVPQTTDEEQPQPQLNEAGSLAEALEEQDPALATPEDAAEGEGELDSAAPAAGGARLIVKRNGAETSEEFNLNPPSIIGRFDPSVGPIDVDLGPLQEGVYVSRKHAKITCDDGVWKIHDLGSSNGTFLLGDSDFERVEEAELRDGSELALGNARFVFKLS